MRSLWKRPSTSPTSTYQRGNTDITNISSIDQLISNDNLHSPNINDTSLSQFDISTDPNNIQDISDVHFDLDHAEEEDFMCALNHQTGI